MITKHPALRAGIVRALASAAVLVASLPVSAQPVDFAPGRILLETRAGLPDVALQRILAEHGGGSPRRVGRTNLHVVNLPAAGGEAALVERLSKHPHVKYAELDRKVPVTLAVSDPYVSSEWHIAKVGADVAWDTAQGAGVTIAVLDSGVDGTHPDLAARLVAGWNMYDNNADTTDVYGHGTKVAGTAAAIGNNGQGVAGVAMGANVMPIRVTDTAGYGYYSAISQGITWAADHGARVATISFAGVAGSSAILSASSYMRSKNGLVVCSAGNSGALDSTAPSTAIIPVSATDSNDVIASWSSYGPYVALSAPGVGIYTTVSGGGYGAVSGTSFSSPLTAGVIALMMSANPALANTQIESLLFSTAVDLGAAGRDAYYGYGRVNAAAAVAGARNTVAPVADTQPPSVAVTSPSASLTVAGLVPVNVSASDNVGVTKVELRVNGTLLGTSTAAPYAFSWDTTTLANGTATLQATAYDAAGNKASSSSVGVTVSNAVVADTTPPVVTITNPTGGAKISGGFVTVSVAASDNAGSSGIRQSLKIDGKVVATGTGSSLNYKWNTNKLAAGTHTIEVTATDGAGNVARQAESVMR